MPASKNTYIGGLDRNTSKSKYKNTNYYDAKNIKVITEGGLSTGSIENEKGNKFTFSIPDLPKQFVIKPSTISSELTVNFGSIGTQVINNVVESNVYQTLISHPTMAALITAGDVEVVEVGETAIVYDLTDQSIGWMSPEYMVDATSKVTSPKIIGHGMLHDDVILFTTSSEEETPVGTDGQIWKFKYDEINGTVIGINGIELDRKVHLLNNSKLNFSTNYRIEEAVCRYENIKTGRIYFTDYNNSLRTFNAYSDRILLKQPSEFDIVDSISMSIPVVDGIGIGGIGAGSVVQVGYRLVNTISGTVTTMSPSSTLIHLTQYDPNLEEYQTYQGSTAGAVANSRSITYTIKDIDIDYDLIEHFAVVYSYQDNPTIVKFSEEAVPATGELTVTFNGTEDYIYFTSSEFNILNQSFVAKTLTSIDDRLVAANIKQAEFDVDFDARAYRFNSGSNVIKLHDTNNNEISKDTSQPSFNWSDIPEDHDAINYYNQEYPEFYLGNGGTQNDWKNNYQKKYQKGSTTVLGGTGGKVSYKFVSKSLSGNENLANPTTVPGGSGGHIVVPRFLSSDGPSILGTKNADGTNREYPIADQYKNQKSPLISTLWTGYARGETYRFGITFFDLKGNPSYVKWIGDIKFPNQYDGIPSTFSTGSPWKLINSDSTITSIRNIAIEFTVDISSLVGEISGFSIVRAERKEKDKTRLGTGVISQFEGVEKDLDQKYNIYSSWRNTVNLDNSEMGTEFDEINGASDQKCITISDRFSHTEAFGTSTPYKNLINFRSPLSQFRNYNNYNSTSLDWLQPTEIFFTKLVNCYNDTSDKSYAFYMKVEESTNPLRTSTSSNSSSLTGHTLGRYFLINSERELKSGEAIDFNESVFDGFDNSSDYNYLLNAYPTLTNNSNNKGEVLGLGNNTHLLNMREPNLNPLVPDWWTDPSVLFGLGNSSTLNNFFYSGQQGWNNETHRRNPYLTSVSYNRFVTNQYGGWSHLQRSKTKYIETGHFQTVNEINSGVLTSDVWGGDTYTTYHDEEMIVPYSDVDQSSSQSFEPPIDKKQVGIAVVYPAETSINTHLRIGKHWAKSKDYDTDWLLLDGTQAFEDLDFNEVYNQQSNIKATYIAKDPIAPVVEEFPHMIKVSEAKVDGELIDNWATFKPLVFDEVEGLHGPINKIVAFRNALLFYQTNAVGSVIINERVAIPNQLGDAIVLGDGSVINKPSYVTKETGALHQFSVVSTPRAVYHYDDVRRKIYKFAGEMIAVTDLKHISSFFNDIIGNLIKNDKTLQGIGKGVHSTYDYKNNRAIFTFLGVDVIKDWASGTFESGQIIVYGGMYYLVNSNFTYTASDKFEDPQTPDDFDTTVYPNLKGDFKNGFTITYNELIDSFESFMDYVPQIYMDCNRRLLTVDPEAKGKAYIQDDGTYGEFYENKYDSHIELLINPHADYTKVFDNIEFKSEIKIDDVDQPTETLSSLQFYNDYQDTGVIPLVIGTNIQERMRTWRSRIPRHNGTKARMRDSHIRLILKFENDNNKRLVLHDVITHFRVANM